MATKRNDNLPTNAVIQWLVSEAQRAADKERRADQRYAFFRAVSLHVNGHCFSAFSRDISASTLGLLHDIKLPPGEIDVTIQFETGQSIKLRTRIERCEPCGAGWYLSYGEFVDSSGKPNS